MKKIIYLLSIVSVFALASCQKPDILNDAAAEEEIVTSRTMNDLIISKDFDWKTTQDVNIELNYNTSGIVSINSVENETFQKAFVKSNEVFKTKVTVPTYMKSLKVTYNGSTKEIPISDGTIKISS